MSVIAEVAACVELCVRLASASADLRLAEESLSRSLQSEKNSLDDSLTLASDSTSSVYRRLQALSAFGDVLGSSGCSALGAFVDDVQVKLREQVRLTACIQSEVSILSARLSSSGSSSQSKSAAGKTASGFFALLSGNGKKRGALAQQLLEDYRCQLKQLSDNALRVDKAMDAVEHLHQQIMDSDTFKSGLVFKDFRALRNLWIRNDFKDGTTCERFVDAIRADVRGGEKAFDHDKVAAAMHYLEDHCVRGAAALQEDGSKYIGKQKVASLGLDFVDCFRRERRAALIPEEAKDDVEEGEVEPLLADFAAWLAERGEELQNKSCVVVVSQGGKERQKPRTKGRDDTSASRRAHDMSALGAEVGKVGAQQEERNGKINDTTAKRISATQDCLFGGSAPPPPPLPQCSSLPPVLTGEFARADLENLKLDELKELCVAKGIKVAGKGWPICCPPTGCKADIVNALCRHSAGAARGSAPSA